MKKNVGSVDAFLRISFGLTCFGYGILNDSKLSIAIGSMKVAEGISGFCPMLALLGLSTNNDQIAEYKYVYKNGEVEST